MIVTRLRKRENPSAVEPAHSALVEWLRNEAAWYRQDEGAVSELVADRIEQLALSAEQTRSSTTDELVRRSCLLRRYRRLDQAEVDEQLADHDRRESFVASLIDCEAAGYLRPDQQPAGPLVAWCLYQLAEDAEYFGAQTVAEYLDSEAAFRAEVLEADRALYPDPVCW